MPKRSKRSRRSSRRRHGSKSQKRTEFRGQDGPVNTIDVEVEVADWSRNKRGVFGVPLGGRNTYHITLRKAGDSWDFSGTFPGDVLDAIKFDNQFKKWIMGSGRTPLTLWNSDYSSFLPGYYKQGFQKLTLSSNPPDTGNVYTFRVMKRYFDPEYSQ